MNFDTAQHGILDEQTLEISVYRSLLIREIGIEGEVNILVITSCI